LLQEFYKVVVLVDDTGALRSSAYILSQAELVTPQNLGSRASAAPSAAKQTLPLGQFKTFQVSVGTVEEKTGLKWIDAVKAADVFKAAGSRVAPAAAAVAKDGARELKSFKDIVL
jgi:DNA/RNA endonuclease G (NUC1)